jgi:hypothetical protein
MHLIARKKEKREKRKENVTSLLFLYVLESNIRKKKTLNEQTYQQ